MLGWLYHHRSDHRRLLKSVIQVLDLLELDTPEMKSNRADGKNVRRSMPQSVKGLRHRLKPIG